jgi:hypothetical protein
MRRSTALMLATLVLVLAIGLAWSQLARGIH